MTELKRILHCSDLHYGPGFQPSRAEKLLQQIHSLNLDAVVISGDLTMRARAGQFLAARSFMEQIQVPRLVIPGNHDVPLFNLPLRFTNPFRNYRRYAEDMGTNPLKIGDTVAFFGINTVNPMRHQKGRVTADDLQGVSRWLGSLPGNTWRVIVTHQHFSDLEGNIRPGVMERAGEILDEFSRAGAHLVLCGHTHFCHVGSSADAFPSINRPIVVVNAGTATSCRARAADCGPKANTFNLLEFSQDSFAVNSFSWDAEKNDFSVQGTSKFSRSFYGEAG